MDPTYFERIRKYGTVLEKAMSDPFTYALYTKSGTLFRFNYAKESGDSFITLYGIDEMKPAHEFAPVRGIDVALSDISWVMDEGH